MSYAQRRAAAGLMGYRKQAAGRAAEPTPSDLVKIAVARYGATAGENGVSHVPVRFPDMHSAAAWAKEAGIAPQVRLLIQHSAPGPRVGYLSEPVTVIYEF